MRWHLSHRADPLVVPLADRHYNRQKIGSPQFAPPGRCVVLFSDCMRAFWITSWPYAQYVKHQWAGAWVCSAFRSEGAGVASELIKDAVAATRAVYGDAPPLGMVTFLNTTKVKPIKVRGANTWGRTWEKAGFKHVGWTKGGLMAFQLLPCDMPAACPALPMNLYPWRVR